MGHYDDHYAEADRKEAEAREQRIQERAKRISQRMNKVGTARVLSEIIEMCKHGGADI